MEIGWNCNDNDDDEKLREKNGKDFNEKKFKIQKKKKISFLDFKMFFLSTKKNDNLFQLFFDFDSRKKILKYIFNWKIGK